MLRTFAAADSVDIVAVAAGGGCGREEGRSVGVEGGWMYACVKENGEKKRKERGGTTVELHKKG